MIHIPAEIRRRMVFLAGDTKSVDNRPVPIFEAARVEFLADLSKALLAKPQVRDLPDVIAFAFWCRRAELNRLASRLRKDNYTRIGLGLIFHICPANVPVNLAFSLAFGLLSGNSCVLRLPSRPSASSDLISQTVAELLDQDRHHTLVNSVLLARFERDDEINCFWLSVADGRVVWGGDQTVAHLRSLPCRPRSREVAFPDRYSFCIMQPQAVLELDDSALQVLCSRLFNDLYLMDQAACSSPQLVAWIGNQQEVKAAKARLWPKLAQHAMSRYSLEPVQAMDKYVQSCLKALDNEKVTAIKRHDNILYRIELTGLATNQDEYRGYFGTIHEVTLEAVDSLAPIISERYQTLTYFGLDPITLRNFVLDHRLRGIDRIVPIGKALDMGAFWDGYDIVGSLSRVIDVQ